MRSVGSQSTPGREKGGKGGIFSIIFNEFKNASDSGLPELCEKGNLENYSFARRKKIQNRKKSFNNDDDIVLKWEDFARIFH